MQNKNSYELACNIEIFSPTYFCETNNVDDIRKAWDMYKILASEKYVNPSPYFNSRLYLKNLGINKPADVIELFLSEQGNTRGVEFCELFASDWYKKRYMEQQDKTLPFLHYVKIGRYKKFCPSPIFDTAFYLSQNNDVESSGIDPLLHYMVYGEKEGRKANNFFDLELYRNQIKENKKNYITYLGHYYQEGALLGLKCNSDIYFEPNCFTLEKEVYGSLKSPDLMADRLKKLDAQSSRDYIAASYTIQRRYQRDHYVDTFETSSALYSRIKASITEKIEIHESKEDRANGFTIFTSYYAHFKYFEKCIESVTKLMEQCDKQNIQIEWLIANDDENLPQIELKKILPANKKIKLIDYKPKQGIVGQFNRLWPAAKYNWLVYLDCDDQIETTAVEILTNYISNYPSCRFISSTCNDIDQEGRYIRRRIRAYTPGALIKANHASHMMAIRKDALIEYNGFNKCYDFIQDYELSLRIASNENILFIPEALYNYRWHTETQSTKLIERNWRLDNNLKHHFIYERLESKVIPKNYNSPKLIYFIVRTQGERLDLLVDSIKSISYCNPRFVAIVVGHGMDSKSENLVCSYLTNAKCQFKYLSASDAQLARGYPLNIALKWLLNIASDDDMVAILDDDDIIYPEFEEFLNISVDSDIVLAQVNRRNQDWTLTSHGPLYPSFLLLEKNTIPINSFAIRAGFLRKERILFREDLDYHEDWNFLIDCYMADAKFEYKNSIVAEYRMTGDGNSVIRKNPKSFEESIELLRYLNKTRIARISRNKLIKDLSAYRRYGQVLAKSMAEELNTFLNKFKG